MPFIIQTPSLIIDKEKVLRNISKMADKAKKNNLTFRPHFKTHQSIEIGNLFRNAGIDKITVSSVTMAEYFANDGWNDITIAFPVNIREIDKINSLNRKIKLNLLIDSAEAFYFLEKNLNSRGNLFVKIDCGYGRVGIPCESIDLIDSLISLFEKSSKLNLLGFLTHSGHTYHVKSREEILKIFYSTNDKLIDLNNRYSKKYLISIGDTPSCSIGDNFEGIDEIRPGNFVFFDWMQYNLGSCDFNEIAVAVACSVVSIKKDQNKAVIYGGAVHFSKEFILENNERTYGQVIKLNNNYSWNEPIGEAFITSLSQEHGIVIFSKDSIKKLKTGDLIGIIPIHSCLTNNLLRDNIVYLMD